MSRIPLSFISAALLLLAVAACQSAPEDDAGRRARVESLYAKYKTEFPAVTEIRPEAALALAAQGRLLPIDTRAPAERAVSTLPGALTGAAYLAHPGDFGDRVPVAYCTIGYRSGLFAREAAQKGLFVANLAGGILAWLHAGGPLVDPDGQPTRKVHVYGRTWNLAPLSVTPVW